MATGSVLLLIAAGVLPDGSASNAAPALRRLKSSAGPPTPYDMQALFDPATREQLCWGFRMPSDYGSAPVLKVQCKTTATSGNVVFEGRVAAITPGDAVSMEAKAFGAANVSAATAVPASAGRVFEVSLALTNDDSLAAGDKVTIYLARAAESGSDTVNADDVAVVAVTLEYTTA